jgi:subtilisin family serine protease
VGAVDAAGKLADFSNFGPWVDIYALGKDLINAFPRGIFVTKENLPEAKPETRDFRGTGMARWSGTSFATPLVAGKIAAQMSRTGQTAPEAAATLLEITRGLNMPQGP